MSDSQNDGFSKDDWDDNDGLAWNEFDWEHYLRDQDKSIADYIKLYEKCPETHERLDETAKAMGWDIGSWNETPSQSGDESDDADETEDEDFTPYTVHRNPVFVASRAIFLILSTTIEKTATRGDIFPVSKTVALLIALNRCENTAMLGIHGLDFGDYGLGVSELKRAMLHLNTALSIISSPAAEVQNQQAAAFREYVLSRLFDLREIWLRVMAECRHELERQTPPDGEASDE